MDRLCNGQLICRSWTASWEGSAAEQFFEALAVAGLRGSCGPRLEIVAFERGGKFRRRPEKFPGLGFRETRQPRRLEICGASVRRFYEHLQRLWQLCRQPETQMDGGEQPFLHGLVAVADHRLERRDHVADDIFRRVVQQDRKSSLVIESWNFSARQRFDEQRMLRDGKDVTALRLPVPARDAREAMRNVIDFDVERGGVEQIEASSGQHPLPRARRTC